VTKDASERLPEQPPPGDSPSESDPQDSVGRVVLRDEAAVVTSVQSLRTRLGVVFLLAGGLVVAIAFGQAYRGLDDLRVGGKEEMPLSVEHLMFAQLAVHAIVTLALVYLGYSLFRAAERMFIPRWLLQAQDTRDVDVIRAILGIDTPGRTAVRMSKETLKAVGSVLAPILGAIRGRPAPEAHPDESE
jgi:hypothetical protein